jgi:hypothetical protein
MAWMPGRAAGSTPGSLASSTVGGVERAAAIEERAADDRRVADDLGHVQPAAASVFAPR